MSVREKTGTCVVCGGNVVEDIVRRLDPHQQQFLDVSEGFHCTRCGLRYEFLPPRRRTRKRKAIEKDIAREGARISRLLS